MMNANQPINLCVTILSGCGVNEMNKKGEHSLFSAVLSRVDIKVCVKTTVLVVIGVSS